MYKPIGYIYVNYVVWPEYRFQKCIWDFSGCKEGQKFSKYSGYSKLTENNKVCRKLKSYLNAEIGMAIINLNPLKEITINIFRNNDI